MCSVSFFELFGNFQYCFAGSNHIVHNDYIFAGNIITKEFHGDHRMLSIHQCRIVAAFEKHTHIDTKLVGIKYRTAHTALIRADRH